jgi:gliding motility-associated lipoprotein GldH
MGIDLIEIKVKSKIGHIILVIFSCFLLSCGEEAIYQENVEFENAKWAMNNNVKFEFTIDDIDRNYNLVYMLRNSLDYRYYNLYMQYTLRDSVGEIVDQNLQEVILMNKKTGEPYGRGFSNIYDHQFVSLRDYKFEHSGKYHFIIDQYMRLDTLPEIYSIGLKILNSPKSD